MVVCFAGTAQKTTIPVYLKHGTLRTSGQKIQAIDPSSAVWSGQVFEGRLHLLLQFKSIPSVAQKNRLAEKGIELLEYIPENTYLAAVTSSITSRELDQAEIISVFDIQPEYKIDPLLISASLNQRVKVHVSYFKKLNRNKISGILQ